MTTVELEIGERELPNGLTLLAVRNPDVSTFAAGFGVSASHCLLSNVSAVSGDVGFLLTNCSANACSVHNGATGFEATGSMLRGCYVNSSVATDYTDNGGNTLFDNSF